MIRNIDKFAKFSIILGIVTIVTLFLQNKSNQTFFIDYLSVFTFFISASIGATFLILLMYLTRAGWETIVKRVPEHLMSLLPIFSLFFILIN